MAKKNKQSNIANSAGLNDKAMSKAEEIEKILSDFESPLHPSLYSPVEKAAIWTALIVLTGVSFGLIFANDIFWDEGLRPIIWDPIVKDAGAAGDAGYSPENTALYATTVLVCVVIFQAIFRKMQIPVDDRMMYALISWVLLAPVLRVLEDADFFNSSIDCLFISPIIHIHLAIWLIAIAFISHKLASKWDDSQDDLDIEKSRTTLFVILGFLLFLHWSILYQPSYSNNGDMGKFWVVVGFSAALATLFLIIVKTAKWPALTRGLLAFGTSASVLGFFHWIQFLATPWPQESGRVVESQPLWPIVIVIGIPALVCYFLYKAGADDAKHIKLCGYEPGVLPDGVSLKTWDDSKELVAKHPIEVLSNKALLANPMVLAMVFGQLCDGFATMVGIDMFGYGEKHPVSDAVIQFGVGISESLGIEPLMESSNPPGAWLFAIVKSILVAAIVWLFIEMRVEKRQVHMRMLIVLAVLIVGLAPGIRDIGRLTLDV